MGRLDASISEDHTFPHGFWIGMAPALPSGTVDDWLGKFHEWVKMYICYEKRDDFIAIAMLVNSGGGSNPKNASLDGVQDVNWTCFEFAIWWIYLPNQDAKSWQMKIE